MTFTFTFHIGSFVLGVILGVVVGFIGEAIESASSSDGY